MWPGGWSKYGLLHKTIDVGEGLTDFSGSIDEDAASPDGSEAENDESRETKQAKVALADLTNADLEAMAEADLRCLIFLAPSRL